MSLQEANISGAESIQKFIFFLKYEFIEDLFVVLLE